MRRWLLCSLRTCPSRKLRTSDLHRFGFHLRSLFSERLRLLLRWNTVQLGKIYTILLPLRLRLRLRYRIFLPRLCEHDLRYRAAIVVGGARRVF